MDRTIEKLRITYVGCIMCALDIVSYNNYTVKYRQAEKDFCGYTQKASVEEVSYCVFMNQ